MGRYLFLLPQEKILYVTGGTKPDVVSIISDLTGMEAVNGFETILPDEEVALCIIDCGGTLRCGLYPKRGFIL